jgi:hypothetical protein
LHKSSLKIILDKRKGSTNQAEICHSFESSIAALLVLFEVLSYLLLALSTLTTQSTMSILLQKKGKEEKQRKENYAVL